MTTAVPLMSQPLPTPTSAMTLPTMSSLHASGAAAAAAAVAMVSAATPPDHHVIDVTQCCGSGRRKRSKPTRVFTDAQPPTLSTSSSSSSPHTPTPAHHVAIASSCHTTTATTTITTVATTTTTTSDTPIDTPPPVNHSRIRPREDDDDSASCFATKYHRLGAELASPFIGDDQDADRTALNKDGGSRPSLDGASPRVTSGSDGLTTRRLLMPVGSLSGQEFYCEACNKEFSNDYFLKSHMSKRHGVFECPSPCPRPPLLQDMTSLGQDTHEDKSQLPGLGKPQDSDSLLKRKLSPPMSLSLSSLAGVCGTFNTCISVPPPALPVPASLVNKQLTSGACGLAGGIMMAGGMSNMEDYCDICQKHFCNKYYLKKHKNDVHGIGEVSVSASVTNVRTASAFPSLMSPLCLPPPPPPPPLTAMSVAPLSEGGCLPPSTGTPPSTNTPSNMMFLNPFAPGQLAMLTGNATG